MRTSWIPLLFLLSACSRSRPVPDAPSAADEALGVERAAATAAFCAGACSAAGREDCTRTCRKCDFEVDNFTQVGGYVLACGAAMPAACGLKVGYRTCILKCLGGDGTSSGSEEGGAAGSQPAPGAPPAGGDLGEGE